MGLTDDLSDIYAEQSVLGSMLIDERIHAQLFATVAPADFRYDLDGTLFLAARALFRAGQPVDPVTVLDAVAGKVGRDVAYDYIAQLLQVTPTAVNWRSYAAIMRDTAALARIRDLAEQLQSSATLDDCRPLAAALGDELNAQQRARAYSMTDLIQSFYDYVGDSDSPEESLSFGFQGIDSGIYPRFGDVVIIAGRPSTGKTALALQIAYRYAARFKVGFFSCETNRQTASIRLVSNVANVSFAAANQKRLEPGDYDDIAAKVPEMERRNLSFFESGGFTAEQIESISTAYGFRAIFIDYVQLIEPDNPRATRTEQVGSVSRSLHAFAQRTQTAVFELAQFSRDVENGAWRKPTLADIRESGQLEQDADLVLLLYKPDPQGQYGKDQDIVRKISVAKNKSGKTGGHTLCFDGAHQQFLPMTAYDRLKKKQADKPQHNKPVPTGEPVSFTEITPEESGPLPF